MLPSSGATVSFRAGDVDGDGDLDIVQTKYAPSEQVNIYELQGTQFAPPISLICPERIADPLLIDADADGDLDLVVASDADAWISPLYLYEQTGPLIFQGASIVDPHFPNLAGLQAVDFDRDGDQDILWASQRLSSVGLLPNESFGPIGSVYCANGVPNSTGLAGSIAAGGSDAVGDNTVILSVRQLPTHTFGFFVGSQVQASVFPIPNSIGRLCLGGAITRFTQAGQVQSSGPSGQFFVEIDLSNIPAPTGTVTATPGETWNFQAWHRDVAMGTASSNFTSAMSILLR